MRDGVIISQVPSPRLPPRLEGGGVEGRGGGGVLCYHDDLVKLVKGRPVNPKLLLFFFLFVLFVFSVGEDGERRCNEAAVRDTSLQGKATLCRNPI